MPKDRKYGEVVLEHGDIGEDEPVIVFRARDSLLPELLMTYHLLCKKSGSPERHLNLIEESYTDIKNWQNEHQDKVRVPNSENSRNWLPS